MRTEVLIVDIMNAINSLSNLDESPPGNKIRLFVLSITNCAIDLVSQAIV